MSGYVLTPLTKADIFEIWSHIAEDSENAADGVERAIFKACEFVSEAPERGHARPDFTPRLLRFLDPNSLSQLHGGYRYETAPVQIIAVVHGKRNIQPILKGRL